MLARAVAVVTTFLASSGAAWATVDEKCLELASGGPPVDYDEQAQQDFLQNYFALSSTLSAIHGPVPHEAGHGAVGLDLGVLPPLGCSRRLVLSYTKTEDTNKSPVIPRPRITFAFPAIARGRLVPYGGAAYLPPVKINGVTNVILSGELGIGLLLGTKAQLGARLHATSHKTVGEVATPFIEGDPPSDDLFIASTVGLDLMAGLDLGSVVPYLSIGVTDASTFFYIGDDNVVANNFHPYFGWVASLGADALVQERIRLGGELYAAPGGYSRPDKSIESVTGMGRYGRLYTVRMKVAYEL